MSKFTDKMRAFWLFNFRNPKVRDGEHGGFKWVFRRFWLDVRTVSGNFKARFTASEHPYGYLVVGKDDSNIEGYCQMLYTAGMLLTTDQGFVNDVKKAVDKYEKRLEKQAAKDVVEDETEEKIAIEEVKQVQEYVEMPAKERKQRERDVNGRFKKAVKDVQAGSDSDI